MQEPSEDHVGSQGSPKLVDDEAAHGTSRRGRPVFLVWAPSSPRAEGLSRVLGAELVMLSYGFKRRRYAPVKYPMMFAKSISRLAKRKPELIICQEPSPLCTLAALTYHYLFDRSSRIIVDAHTADFYPPWSRLRVIHSKILARVGLVIVTNKGLKKKVISGYSVKRCQVLADKVPVLGSMPSQCADPRVNDHKSSFKVVAICSFAPDEPIENIIAAAGLVPEATFYITGDYGRTEKQGLVSRARKNYPNIVFTGFLSKSDYIALLRDADIVMALTDRDDTMLSGANEALGLAKPLITSSWAVLREYFDRGALFVDNSPAQLAGAVRKAKNLLPQLAAEIEDLRTVRRREWMQQFAQVRAIIRDIAPASALLIGTQELSDQIAASQSGSRDVPERDSEAA